MSGLNNIEALNRIGPLTTHAAKCLAHLAATKNRPSLFSKADDPFELLGDALRGWKDAEAAAVVTAVDEAIRSFRDIESAQVSQWIRAHSADPVGERAKAVVDCIRTNPPPHVKVVRRLSTAGSQKLVFLAKWYTTQSEIVLKRFIRPELAEQVIQRELTAHSLSLRHANIIETHLQSNSDNESFLLEKKLQEVLNDSRVPHSVVEAANLLHDMASALEFLESESLVHGDLKPDNIGRDGGRYILLDFGICRPADRFEGAGATGSLRTRAPELLIGGDAKHSYSSDVWALGATVYRGFAHRFPLIKNEEQVPRISKPDERSSFERILADRASNEYNEWLDFESVPDVLKDVLKNMLLPESMDRWSAKRVREYCTQHLAAVLREHGDRSSLSPADEIAKLNAYLPSVDVLALMPQHERQELNKRLHDLGTKNGLSDEQQRQIGTLQSRLPD